MGESISFWEPQCFWDSGILNHMRQLTSTNKKRAQKRLSLYRFALGARCVEAWNWHTPTYNPYISIYNMS